MRRCLRQSAVLFLALGLVGCAPQPQLSVENPLQDSFTKNTVCGPARSRPVAAMSEVLTNRMDKTLSIIGVRAVHPSNLDLRFARVGPRIEELPIITGDPSMRVFDAMTDGPYDVRPGDAYQLVVVGDVIDKASDAVVHGFEIRYEYDGETVVARTPSTLTFAAGSCS